MYNAIFICSFSIIISFILIIFFCIYEDMRRPPGGLMMMIIFSEMILSIHWFIHGLYRLIYDKDPKTESYFC